VVAFYVALAANDSAVQAMGDAKLKVIAAEAFGTRQHS
jgi:type I restriction enzyme R subunit